MPGLPLKIPACDASAAPVQVKPCRCAAGVPCACCALSCACAACGPVRAAPLPRTCRLLELLSGCCPLLTWRPSGHVGRGVWQLLLVAVVQEAPQPPGDTRHQGSGEGVNVVCARIAPLPGGDCPHVYHCRPDLLGMPAALLATARTYTWVCACLCIHTSCLSTGVFGVGVHQWAS